MAFGEPLPEGNLGRPESFGGAAADGVPPVEDPALVANRKIFALQLATDNARLTQTSEEFWAFVTKVEDYLK